MSDSVYKKWGEWYFRDEIVIDRQGPFETELIAREELRKYYVALDLIV